MSQKALLLTDLQKTFLKDNKVTAIRATGTDLLVEFQSGLQIAVKVTGFRADAVKKNVALELDADGNITTPPTSWYVEPTKGSKGCAATDRLMKETRHV